MKRIICGILGLALLAGSSVWADDEALLRENEALKQRMERMEENMQALESRLNIQPSRMETAMAGESVGVPVTSKFQIQAYGKVKYDMAWDDSRMVAGNLDFYVLPEDNRDSDEEFNATARESRVGLSIAGPTDCNIETTGKIEIDFYGRNDTEQAAHPRMRHAYMNLFWREADFAILAGQTWDIISPMVMPTLNFAVGGDAGSLGLRNPQLRLTKGWKFDEDTRISLALGVSRTIGDNIANSPGDTGEDAGFPTFQGRLAAAFPIAGRKAEIGLWGHWGQEEYDTDAMDHNEDIDTWSVGMDFNIPLHEKVSLWAEVFRGENLDQYYGGIGQGVNSDLDAIASTGGFAALRFGPFDKLSFAAGFGMDNPEDDDLDSGAREKNTVYFGNVVYNLNSAVQVGLELSRWQTDYKDLEDAENTRVQTSFIYNF